MQDATHRLPCGAGAYGAALVFGVRIELFDGHSSIVLEGGNITFTLPGLYSAHHATHEFMPPGGGAVDLPALPKGSAQVPPLDLELNLHDEWLQPVAGSPYVVVFEDGSRRSGTLDDAGHAIETGVPNLKAQVFYGEQPEAPQPRVAMPANTFSPGGADNDAAIARIETHLDQAQQFYAESASAEQRELHIELNGQHDNGNGENLWNYLDEAAQQALRRKLQGEAP
jgi:type VI secretion system secreted protein VgrG